MLLGAHPELCSVGELKATSLGNSEKYLCSCMEKITQCPFWTGISRDMSRKGITFDITNAGTDIRSNAGKYVRKVLNTLHRGPILEKIRDLALWLSPTWRKNLPRIQNVNTNLMQCILSRTEKKAIVDSSKIGIRLKYLLRNPSLDVKIIRLIRDGRGVALTYIDPTRFADANDPALRAGGLAGNREIKCLPMEKAAYEWRRSNEEAEEILRHVDPSRWVKIRYEELCNEPKRVLQELFSFIGVDPTETIDDFRSVEHHVIGNGMRLDSHNEIMIDDRWKTIINPVELNIFDSVAGEMNQRLGYR
jgi:hypothetical protein